MANQATPNKCNLIINYLPQSLTDQEFHELFEAVGKTTSTRIIRDKTTNYSFGYGFVNYASEEDAANAIEQLNGQKLQHKTIKVAYSQPSGIQTKNINLHVSGLAPDADEQSVRELFSRYGTVVQCRVVPDKMSGQCQGFGFILYSCRDEALLAIKALNGYKHENREDCKLTVKFAKFEQKGPPSSYLRMMGFNTPVQYGIGSYGNAPVGMKRGGGPMRGNNFYGRFSPMTPRGNPNSYGSGFAASEAGGDSKYQSTYGGDTIVFVYGIGPHCNEDALFHMFSPFGTIKKVNVIYDYNKGIGKGYGFVTYSSYSEASYAICNMNGTNYEGRTLQVSIKADLPK